MDRGSKDRRVLFRGTFDALARGEAVALFPEGTSYTQPQIMQVKDGAGWAALEYMKWATENGIDELEVKIVPAAIVYTNKSKYRSDVGLQITRRKRKVLTMFDDRLSWSTQYISLIAAPAHIQPADLVSPSPWMNTRRNSFLTLKGCLAQRSNV